MEIVKLIKELDAFGNPLLIQGTVSVIFIIGIVKYIVSERNKIFKTLLSYKKLQEEIKNENLDEESKELFIDRQNAKVFFKEIGIYAEKMYRAELCRYIKANRNLSSADITLASEYLKYRDGKIVVLIKGIDKFNCYFNKGAFFTLMLLFSYLTYMLIYLKYSISFFVFYLIFLIILLPLIHSSGKEIRKFQCAKIVLEDLKLFYS